MSMGIKALLAGAVGALASASAVRAQCGAEAYAWPAGSFGFPSGPNYLELAAGQDFIVAIRPDGSLQKFGSIDNPPTGEFLTVSAGFAHAAAIRSDRRVVAWGFNNFGQTNVPANLPDAAVVATTYTCSAIIDIHGAIHCWGWQASGQTASPSGSFTAIDGGEWHFIALNVSGEVKCWGNTAGALVPRDLGPCIAVAAGGGIVGGFVAGHSVAVKTDGSVRCWGDDGDGQCAVPSDLPPVTAVAAGGPHTVALLANGTIRAWGRGSNGQTAISAPPLTRFRKLATGEQTSFAIADPPDLDGDGIPGCSDNCPTTPNPDQLDCNHNGIGEACETFADCNSNSLPDSCDIASGTSADADANGVPDTCQPDCNLNDLPDTFEIASGLVSDLNADGTPDDCQGARMVRLRSPNLGSPSGAAARVWNVAELALAESSVTVTVDVRGDLNGQTEWADIVLNDGPPRRFFQSDGSLCPSTPDRATITLDRAEFNDLVRETRTLSVRVECPATVDGTECKDAGLTEVALDYVGIADGGDCNGNERLDVVEVFDGTSPDCNANKRPDGCDIASGTAGDCDASGVPDSCELDATPSLDCNGNGRIDSCDLASGGTAVDCDQDGTIDSCQVAADPSSDCNGNLRPDACDVGGGTSADIDADGTPDECQTVSVPGDFGSIQAAIDAAPADRMRIIAVAAGTYAGPIAFNGKPVRVRGAGPSQTILDGTAGQQVSVVRFTGNEPSITMLEGVTVRGGQSGTPLPSFPSALVGGGVFGIDSAAGLRNCVVEGNSAGFGAGAYFVRCSGSVDDCAFRGNSASADGGGFQSNQGTQRLTDVVVDGNYANSRGGGMHIVQGNTQLTRVQVTGNQCGNIMGGLSYSASLTAGTTLSLVDCAVTGNVTSLNYGGLGVTGAVGVPVSLSGTTICGNTPLPNMFGSYVDLGGNTVCDCAGDLNLDGAVNGADLGLMLAVWGPCGASCAYDLNLDGLVNGADLGLLLSAWGPCGG